MNAESTAESHAESYRIVALEFFQKLGGAIDNVSCIQQKAQMLLVLMGVVVDPDQKFKDDVSKALKSLNDKVRNSFLQDQ